MKRNGYMHFDDFLPKPKNMCLPLKNGGSSVCRKTLTLYDIVLVFTLLGIAEIILRVIWAPTPLSFLFPVCIYVMYLMIRRGDVDFRKIRYLLLPFFFSTFLLIYLLVFNPLPEAHRIWLMCFIVAYMIVVLLCMLPVIIGIQKCIYYEHDCQKLYFVQFLSIAQLIGASLLFVIISSDKQILLFSEIVNANLNPPWSISLNLAIAVLASLQYIILTKKTESGTYPLSVRLDNCNKEIISLFNEQKIFLNPDLTLNMLSLVAKIDKVDLEIYFNEYIGKSFQYFVAEYRVAYALNLINDKGDLFTLEAIGYESGFRCRASFNKYFKLITGILPSQYLRMKTT